MFDHRRQISFGPQSSSYNNHVDESEQTAVATEEDFIFISEVLQSATQDLQQKQMMPNAMLSLMSMNSKKELADAIQLFSSEIQTQMDEFNRVIEFSSKPLPRFP